MRWRVILALNGDIEDRAAWCRKTHGCVSAEETEQEAMENIKAAISLHLDPESG